MLGYLPGFLARKAKAGLVHRPFCFSGKLNIIYNSNEAVLPILGEGKKLVLGT